MPNISSCRQEKPTPRDFQYTKISSMVPCPICKGSGMREGKFICSRCNGEGEISAPTGDHPAPAQGTPQGSESATGTSHFLLLQRHYCHQKSQDT
ncbi:hypothetical protein VTH82DRAFT_1412 [Thermothelomyces myriococcoides]